jgi:hypothetical protein
MLVLQINEGGIMNKPLEREELDFIFGLYQPDERAQHENPAQENAQLKDTRELNQRQNSELVCYLK